DPVKTPGLTWPTRRTIPGVDLFLGEPSDRIDFVFARGARPIASAVVGEPGAPGVSATVAPWPSDHRLVVSTFRVRGATPPALVTVPHRLVRIGDAVKNAPGERWDWLGIYHRGANPLVASYLLWRYTHSAIDGTFTLRPSGIFAVPLTPGRYTVYLLRDDLYVKIAGANFVVR